MPHRQYQQLSPAALDSLVAEALKDGDRINFETTRTLGIESHALLTDAGREIRSGGDVPEVWNDLLHTNRVIAAGFDLAGRVSVSWGIIKR